MGGTTGPSNCILMPRHSLLLSKLFLHFLIHVVVLRNRFSVCRLSLESGEWYHTFFSFITNTKLIYRRNSAGRRSLAVQGYSTLVTGFGTN